MTRYMHVKRKINPGNMNWYFRRNRKVIADRRDVTLVRGL
jgi:hypothetical protein